LLSENLREEQGQDICEEVNINFVNFWANQIMVRLRIRK
jgi:hypothetical protein